MGNPETGLKCVHVGGTNGKGSVTAMVAAVLEQAGYKVGRFTSPHLCSYRERFMINGGPIPAARLIGYLQSVNDIIFRSIELELRPTEFEILTAVAFAYFRDEQVDVAVIEVGMGGSFDSTNVVQPLVAVITSVDLDHTAFLGGTRAAIAENKAGIIKPGTPVVAGNLHAEAWPVVKRAAQALRAPLHSSREVIIQKSNRTPAFFWNLTVTHENRSISIRPFSLRGEYQLENLATAFLTCQILQRSGYHIEDRHIAAALSTVAVPGRLEVLHQEPLIIADAAHNGHGALGLARSLAALYPGRSRILICTLLDDKDKMAFIEPLLAQTRQIIITNSDNDRSLFWQAWPQLEQRCGHRIIWEEDMIQAFEKGFRHLQQDEYLLITGSFYLVGPALAWAAHLSG